MVIMKAKLHGFLNQFSLEVHGIYHHHFSVLIIVDFQIAVHIERFYYFTSRLKG